MYQEESKKLNSLHNKEGHLVGWDLGLQETRINCFADFFKVTNTKWDEVVRCISRKVSNEQNSELLKPVDDEEVKTTLFHM